MNIREQRAAAITATAGVAPRAPERLRLLPQGALDPGSNTSVASERYGCRALGRVAVTGERRPPRPWESACWRLQARVKALARRVAPHAASAVACRCLMSPLQAFVQVILTRAASPVGHSIPLRCARSLPEQAEASDLEEALVTTGFWPCGKAGAVNAAVC